ncbi:MAG TPA: CDP-alcohol phosphatidyltransferase family protein [Solirubrobacteraceae bacterium]|nr:CDP-alcohol phosphatidyltransferase family protein [Solirubrobacteraceae bacterium]
MDHATPGERWTAQQLAELRRRRFSAPALASFLRASQLQARRTRRARNDLARQARQWIAASALGWLALCTIRPPARRPPVRAGLLWWAACAAMLDWHLGMVETPSGQPRRLGPSDALTLLRAWLVPLAWQQPTAAMCAIAALSDAADGPIARRGEPTRAGRDFDWIVDACFATAALRGCRRQRLLDTWAVCAEAAWLGTGAVRATAAYFARSARPDRSLTRRARPFAPMRAAGVVCAAAGHRRAGSLLLGTGALASLAVSATGLLPRLAAPGAPTTNAAPRGRQAHSALAVQAPAQAVSS